ncbi:leucine-rich repeat domain-containing protein [Alteromonas sp. 5E99-2]|uniref:leucine-rich repeat domain-containing protein n=1 Tax=Alteromonas sp. 5E99-2 TaxID=2817683 RepID=UPI001A98A354|nr:leucine-rich repeat domain-containing protein [Alteromonas sp. 5E99-2]MBO1256456.1 leucine-rich repeat domain-containing protein [Alteromonas sp. 5E99-2]
MRLFSYLSMLVFAFLLFGCETSRTYYGETATAIDSSEAHRRLDLSFQSSKELPENLTSLTELRSLNISGNRDLDISNAITAACQLPNLHVLILNDLDLTSLPKTIENCRSLTQLSLVRNPNLDFEKTFNQLSSLTLEFIDLSHNGLDDLPDSLGGLKTLQDLRLSHNHIAQGDAYKVIAKLPRLFSLWLDNNQLTQVPDEIGLIKTVAYLYLDNNYLTKLPKSVKFMHWLSAIWLGHNCFTQVPITLADRGIPMVFLNNNRISDIGDRLRMGRFFIKGIVLDYNYLDDTQRKESAKLFNNTFIYSDDNQFEKSALTQCGVLAYKNPQ